MAKDPAFLFYSSDFLSGVQDLTMEERGQYITLLCIQHQKGRLSRKAVAIAVPNATADVMGKFKEDENGLFYNERLEKEAIKRKEHAEKQRQRALSGWEKRKKKIDATANATALPLEDVNENVIENIKKEEYLIKLQEFLKGEFINIELDVIKKEAESFCNQMIMNGDIHKTFPEYAHHFTNKLKKLKEKTAPEKTGSVKYIKPKLKIYKPGDNIE